MSAKDEAMRVMRAWILANYKDPANGVPHDSGEGGYQYTNGGPYHPLDLLSEEFGGRYDEEVIEELAGDLVGEFGPDWVGMRQY